MKPLSPRVLDLPRSGIRGVMDIAEKLGDVIHMEVGEPHFQPPAHILEAANEAARAGFNKYTPNAGLPVVREVLADKLRKENGISATADSVVMTPGGVFATACSVLTIADPGDEVLLPEPGWPNHGNQLTLFGVKPVYYPLHPATGFLPEFDELEMLTGPRTKAILVNSPSNPTGAVFPKETLACMLAFAQKHDLYVITDEVYEKIIYEGKQHSLAAWDEDGRVISCFSFSKTYAMTGWRIGFVTASQELCRNFGKLQETMVSCVSSLSQKGAEAAVTGSQEFVRIMVETYRRNRDVACSLFTEAGVSIVEPHGTFYLLVDISHAGLDSYSFMKRLMEEKRVAVAPGLTFGHRCDRYIRISFCKERDSVVEGVRRIIDFLARQSSLQD
jgi:aspartate aminotransferase/aminotransferase